MIDPDPDPDVNNKIEDVVMIDPDPYDNKQDIPVSFKQFSFGWRFLRINDVEDYIMHDQTVTFKRIWTDKADTLNSLEAKILFDARMQTQSTNIPWDFFTRFMKHIRVKETNSVTNEWERRSTKVKLIKGDKFMHMMSLSKTKIFNFRSFLFNTQPPFEFEFNYCILKRPKSTISTLETYLHQAVCNSDSRSENSILTEIESFIKSNEDQEYDEEY